MVENVVDTVLGRVMSRGKGGSRRMRLSTVTLVLTALILAAPASADQHAPEAGAGEQAAASSAAGLGSADAAAAADPTAPLTPDGGEPYPELHVPDDGWRYVTDYFFALTLGLERERIADWVRYTAMVGTVPVDVLTSPGAALAGLFGP